MLLVYGISGTGKSSLVNCGLASRFDESDWLPVNVRRGSNIIDSLNEAFNKQAIRPLKKNLSVSEKLQSIYLDHFKPVYLIFDQFEELFIFGNQEEKEGFIKLIKEITESETQCRIIFIIREEFLAGMTEFESELPDIFTNRFRVEKMKRTNAISAIEGPCKVYEIETEQGFSEELIDKLCPAGNEIELTYLQIYLDRIFRLAVGEKTENGNIRFSKDLLTKAGNVSDLLGQFLEEQIRELENPDTGMSILKSFVSVQGTRRQMNETEILDSIQTFGTVIPEPELLKYLTKFVDLRILRERDEVGHLELRHDALASKIYEKFTALEKDIIDVRQFIENEYSAYEKRGKLLTTDDLKYIAPYEDKLFLNKPMEAFIEKSKKEIQRAKIRRRNITVAATIALLVIFAGFTVWALQEKQKSNLNFIKAKANNFNYLSKETVETDPTIALRLAEFALSIDSTNQDIVKNIKRIYYNNNFYKIIANHKAILSSCAFSPDGQRILTGSWDTTAYLYDLKGKLLQVFKGHKDRISSVAFSPDGLSILTGSNDKTARLWDLQGNMLQEFMGHQEKISSVAFSPNGKSILTGSSDKTARLWDLQGNELHEYKGHQGGIFSVVFSPDGKNILTGSEDNTARLWSLNGNPLTVFKGNEGNIYSIAFSPDGNKIITGSFNAFLWDLHGKLLQKFEGHGGIINSVVFSPDSKRILTGSDDRTARLWDLQGNVLQVFKGHQNPIMRVAFSPDGKSALTSSGDIYSSISGDNTIRLWILQGNILRIFTGHKDMIYSVAFSPNCKSVLTGSYDKTAKLWDLQGNEIQEFKGHEGGIYSVAFSPDGKNILTGSEDNTACLWDLNGNVLQRYKGHEGNINSVAFSPDGKSILTGSDDRTARLWDLQGNILKIFKGHEKSIRSVSFSPDGKSILTGSADRTARLWDLQGNVLQVFKGHQSPIMGVAFSPDGKTIVTGSWDKTARLWDLKGNVSQVIRQYDFVYAVAFSPKGDCILTGSVDKTAYQWDLEGNGMQVFKGHKIYIISSVAFSPDGKSILTGSQDRTARLWELKKNLHEFQKENAYEELSLDQKIKYNTIEISDALKFHDEKSIREAADYYCEEINSIGKDKKKEYINTAVDLYDKLVKKYKDNSYILRRDSLKMLGK
jgi:WD40 repeat protein